MSFFKNLFYGKPQPDNAMTIYLEELKQMSEGMLALRSQFAKYGRSVQVLSNSGLELAHSIRQFSLGLKLTNPPIQEFSHSSVHFREDIFKVWSQQFVEEVLIMFDHWDRQADAQRTTISNYHIAREHCFVLKNELQELLEKKTQFTHSKAPISPEFQAQLHKHEEEYKKYSVALETIRSRIVTNQNKLLGKNGQLQDFSRAFYALLESQINFGAYFKSLSDSYVPLLDQYRTELGISTQTSTTNVGLHSMSAGSNGFSFIDDIAVLDIASFIRETASLEGDRTTLTNIDSILTTFDHQQQQNSSNHSTSGQNQNDPHFLSTTTSGLTLQTDSPLMAPRRSSLAPSTNIPGSPAHNSTIDSNPPQLSFALSTRKKRTTMVPSGPMSPSADFSQNGDVLIAGTPTPFNPQTTKKHSSRATYNANSIPNFDLDGDHDGHHPSSSDGINNNMFVEQQQQQQQQQQKSQQPDDDGSSYNNENTPQIVCAFGALDQDDDDDTFGFAMGSNQYNITNGEDNQDGHSERPIFQSILAKLVDEETDLVPDHTTSAFSSNNSAEATARQQAGNYSVIPAQFTLDDFALLAQKWSLSPLNPQLHTKNRITTMLQTLNNLCTKYIADWVIVEIELQLWEKSPSLHLLLCTLNTLTICKTIQQHQGLPGQAQLTSTVAIDHPLAHTGQPQIIQQQPVQYGFTFRTASRDSAFSYFYYVYNVFTALFYQLLGDNDHDITNNLSTLLNAFQNNNIGSNFTKHQENVQKLVQTTQILRLLTILCDKCLLQIKETNMNANKLRQSQQAANNDDDDEDIQELDEDDEEYDEDEDLDDEDEEE